MKEFFKSFSPGSCTGGDATFGCMFFILLFFYYVNLVGGERAYGRFIFSYAVQSEQAFSSSKAAILNTVFWIGFTSGRGSFSILAHWCPSYILILIATALGITCGVALSVWGVTVPEVLWVFTCVRGLSLAPLFAAGIAWSNQYVEMRGLAFTVVFVGASIGAIVYQWITGYLFEYEGPQTVMYIVLGNSLLILVTFSLMLLLTRQRQIRFKKR